MLSFIKNVLVKSSYDYNLLKWQKIKVEKSSNTWIERLSILKVPGKDKNMAWEMNYLVFFFHSNVKNSSNFRIHLRFSYFSNLNHQFFVYFSFNVLKGILGNWKYTEKLWFKLKFLKYNMKKTLKKQQI